MDRMGKTATWRPGGWGARRGGGGVGTERVRRTLELDGETHRALGEAVRLRKANGEKTDASKLIRRYVLNGLAADGVWAAMRRKKRKGGRS